MLNSVYGLLCPSGVETSIETSAITNLRDLYQLSEPGKRDQID